MKPLLTLAALITLAGTGNVYAQSWRDTSPMPRAILYELPGFQGRQIAVIGLGDNLAGPGFNDLAQSAKFEGRWRVCEDARFRGKCKDVVGAEPDLARLGMGLKVSSLQAYHEGAWAPRDVDGGRPQRGARIVLFPYPSVSGFDVAADGSTADRFCRAMGLGSAGFYDSGERSSKALDEAGRYVGETGVLRDVVCRR